MKSRAEGGVMRKSSRLLALGIALAIGTAGSVAVLAADKETVIKEREALMKKQGADLGAVKGYLDDKSDLAKATAGATDLVQTLKKIPYEIPQGTPGPDPDGKYAAKPEIWRDWKDFLAARDTAAQKADVLLAAVKTGDKAQIQTAFADIGKNGCGACHGKFREELKK
jgi:cytochrome c556